MVVGDGDGKSLARQRRTPFPTGALNRESCLLPPGITRLVVVVVIEEEEEEEEEEKEVDESPEQEKGNFLTNDLRATMTMMTMKITGRKLVITSNNSNDTTTSLLLFPSLS
ncbi:hypothetical protein M0804_012424 [Polistes exclamans]|nr:hypothetical protein M0804_012424 [Polistes exclamans]